MLDQEKLKKFIKEALNEDIGSIDLTTIHLISSQAKVKVDITAKTGGMLCGLPLVECLYNLLDKAVRIKLNAKEGRTVEAGKVVCYIEGQATAILKGERVALNLLNRASGIATITKAFVDKVKPYNVEIFDTRKTTPNMRFIEKYAVRIGGGKNHRMGLYDQVLIKDNHLAIIRNLKHTKDAVIEDIIRTAKKRVQKNVKIEIEVSNIAEFEEALAATPDIILLDNLAPTKIREAVKIREAAGSKGRRVILEASGNMRLENVEEFAKTGIDRISVGFITQSPSPFDFSLEVM